MMATLGAEMESGDLQTMKESTLHFIATCSTGQILMKYNVNVMPWEATLTSLLLISCNQ